MLAHVLRRFFRSLRENLGLNLVGAGVIAAAVVLAAVYVNAVSNLNQVVESWDRDVHIACYFRDGVDIERRLLLQRELEDMPEVQAVDYVSEEDAAAYLLEHVQDVGPILEELGPEVLPASLEVTLAEDHRSPDAIGAFVATVQSDDFEYMDYGQEWVQRFETFLALLSALGLVLGGLIFVAAVFLVGNTMHLVAYARRRELETMKLVGSTFGFASMPFALEGALQGFLGAGAGVLAAWGLHALVVGQLQEALAALADAPVGFLPLGWSLALVASGMVLGVLGSVSAIYRFWRSAP
jgi:cell division transport system permease protein